MAPLHAKCAKYKGSDAVMMACSLTSRHDDWVLWGWGEANSGDPLGVSVLGDGVLALGKSVPQLDGAVAGGRHDLTVVSREGNAQDITSVSDEAASGDTPAWRVQ